ncbi:MAG: DUF1549 domain-containing protein [Verrucomicrobia bacterium]|nr:DUF1549 domain-containing protein [Verrucomicrobiota bacterium]
MPWQCDWSGRFRLSLFGSDPQADYESIVQESFGRRMDRRHPELSLVLLKPTRSVPHEGGHILSESSPVYQTLKQWIADGAPWIHGPPSQFLRLEMIQNPDSSLQLNGYFQRGTEIVKQDLTSRAHFRSTDESVVSVLADHRLSFHGPGEAYVIGQFLGWTHRMHLINSHGELSSETGTVPALGAHESPDPLSRIWRQSLQDVGLEIPQTAEPWRVIRRLFLSVAGRPPWPNELDHLDSLVQQGQSMESLLDQAFGMASQSISFQKKWGQWLSDWLELPGDPQDKKAGDPALQRSLDEVLSGNQSMMDLIRKIVDPQSSRHLRQHYADPRDRAEFVSRAFLGIQLGCARCHNHPDDRWTQINHLRFSACFSNAALNTDLSPIAFSSQPQPDGGMQEKSGDFLYLPGSGYAVKPALLPLQQFMDTESSAVSLVDWIQSSARSTIARNLSNRIFKELIGVALVEPVDDHRLSNPARYESILSVLSQWMMDGDFNLKMIIRQLVMSEPFRIAALNPDELDASRREVAFDYIQLRKPQLLDVDQWVLAVSGVLGVELPPFEVATSPLAHQLALLNSSWFDRALEVPGNQFEVLNQFATDVDGIQRTQELHRMVFSQPLSETNARKLLEAAIQARPGDDIVTSLKAVLRGMVLSPEFCSIR